MRSYLYFVLLCGVILPAGMQAQGLHLTKGASLVVNGKPSIVLNNAGLTNNGQFIADSGTVVFTGDNAGTASFVDGRNPVAFYNLTVTRSSGDLWLHNDAAIGGRIDMQGGNLLLNNHVLDLGTTGSILGESNYSSISGADGGVVKARALLNVPHGANPGNIGVAISSEANLGWTSVARGHIQQNAGTGSGIQRYFDIDPEFNSGRPGSLRFFYLDGELDGKNVDELGVFSSDGFGWTSRGKDLADRTAGWVTKENIGLSHRFTLAIPGSSVNRSGVGLLQVSPNPSAGAFRTLLVCDQEGDRLIGLYDGAGHLLERKKWHCIRGMNVVEWNVTGLAQGAYHLSGEGLKPVTVSIMK